MSTPSENRELESLGEVTSANRPVYLAVVHLLGCTVVVGVLGCITLAFTDHPIPDALSVLLGTASGGLVGLIAGQ